MPVSSLDYSLVDARQEFASDVESVYDELQRVDGDEIKTSLSEHVAQEADQSIDETNFTNNSWNESQSESPRASTWGSLLGLVQVEDLKSHQSQSADKDNVNGTKEKLSIFSEPGTQSGHDFFSMNDLPSHKDEAQVMLDVKRSFTVISHYNSFNSVSHSSYTTILSATDIEAMRKRLYCLIVRVLRKYPSLNYYQGYHDVAGVILLACNESGETSDEQAFRILEVLTVNYLRDFMIQDISLTINHLKLIPLIMENADHELFDLMKHLNNTYSATGGVYYDYKFLPPLSSILTLFSHDLVNTRHLMYVWDFIFEQGSVLASQYIYVALLIHSKKRIFKNLGLTEDLLYEHVDLDLAHSLLSPQSILGDLSDSELFPILEDSKRLLETYPLDGKMNFEQTFDIWFKEFNCDSVIMTTSRLFTSPEQRKGSLPTPDELDSLIKLQELQQQRESENESKLLQGAFDQIDSLSTSINSAFDDSESTKSSIASSFSSLKAASYSLNHTLVSSSSNILKKLISSEADIPEDKNNSSRELTLSIYKISLTIGFVGFMLHFLLKQSEFGSILKVSPKTFLHDAAKQMISCSETNFIRLVNGLRSFVNNAREYGPVRDFTDITQVGLGSIKRSIYTMGFSPQ